MVIALQLLATIAASTFTTENVQCDNPPREEACECVIVPAYNAPCRSIDNCYGLFFSASFTYWQPIQENMKLGLVSDSSVFLDLVNGKESDLNFKYKPGFQVGAGMNFSYDNWDTFIEYTWFYAKESVNVSLDPSNVQINLFPAWQIPNFLNPQYHFGSESWKLTMNFIDWDLRRNYQVGTALCFHSFFGLRGAVIHQTVDVDYVNTNPAYLAVWPSTYIDHSAKSWGIGPRLGVLTSWDLCQGFRLNANGEVDVLFTQYDLKFSQVSGETTPNRYIVKQNNASYLRTHVDLGLGLGWFRSFCNKYALDISLDYEFQVFFDQNVFRSTASAQAVGKSVIPNGNLYLQGLTVTVGFDL